MQYHCSATQAAKAYGIGLLVGSLLTVLLLWIGVLRVDLERGSVVNSILGLPGLIFFFLPMSALFWVVGLALSIPIFLVLHLLKLRDWPYMTILGALLVFGANYALMRSGGDIWLGLFFPHDPNLGRIEHATTMGIIGGLTAFAMWCTAYPHIDLARFRLPIALVAGVLILNLIFIIP